MSRSPKVIARAVQTVLEPLEVRRLMADMTSATLTQTTAGQRIEVAYDSSVASLITNPNVQLHNLTYDQSVQVSRESTHATDTIGIFRKNPDGVLSNGWYELSVQSDQLSTDLYAEKFKFLNGDFDGDQVVSFNDFLTLQTGFGNPEANTFLEGDADYNGAVDFNDFLIFQTYFGQSLANLPAAAGDVEIGRTKHYALDVAWGQSTDPAVTGYRIYRSTDGINFTALIDVGSGVQGWQDKGLNDQGLSPDQKYWYRVRAKTAAGVSESIDKAWGYPSKPTLVPAFVATVSPTVGRVGKPITLKMTAAGVNAQSVKAWEVDWGDGQVETITTAPKWANPTLTTWEVPHIYTTPGTRPISIRAQTLEQNGLLWHPPFSTTATIVTDPTSTTVPSDPAPAFGVINGDQVTLEWTASTGDPDNYHVYASVDGGAYDLYTTVDFSTTTAIYYSAVSAEVAFKISASNEEGESGKVDVTFEDDTTNGGTTTVTTVDGTSVPQPSAGLSQYGVGYTDGVTISWQTSPDADGYVIEWSGGSGGWFAIDETKGNTYTDEYPTLGEQHYRVITYRGENEPVYSAPSPSLAVTPRAVPVAWYDNNAGANSNGTVSPFSVVHDDEDGVEISVVPNDVDYDNGDIWIPAGAHSASENGTVTLDESTGVFTYIPKEDFVGTDYFTYFVTDGYDFSELATIAVDVTNEAPEASPATFEYGNQDLERAIHSDGRYDIMVRINGLSGTDADDDALTFDVSKTANNGDLTVDPESGTFTYIPNDQFNGVDYFTYVVSDGISYSDPALVSIRSLSSSSPLEPVTSFKIGGSNPSHEGYPYKYPEFRSFCFVDFPYYSGGSNQVTFDVVDEPNLGYLAVIDTDFAEWQYGGTNARQFIWYLPSNEVPEPEQPFNLRFTIKKRIGDIVSKPAVAGGNLSNLSLDRLRVPASSTSPTYLSTISYQYANAANALQIVDQPEHGTITSVVGTDNIRRFTYTPHFQSNEPLSELNEPYVGWDFYSVSSSDGGDKLWLQLNVGADSVPEIVPQPQSQWNPSAFNGSLTSLYQKLIAVQAAGRTVLDHSKALTEAMAGVSVGDVALMSTDELFEAASNAGIEAKLSALQSAYATYADGYVEINQHAAQYMDKQRVLWQSEVDVLNQIGKLPLSIGAIGPDLDYGPRMMQALKASAEGAGAAAQATGNLITAAQYTRRVAEVALMAGGGAFMLQGVSLAVAAGQAACIRYAVTQSATILAGVGVSYASPHIAKGLGISDENAQIVADSVQLAFLFVAAYKARLAQACFVAGTQVVTGIDSNGNYITKNIEDIRIGDLVLSRDQYDAGDDLEPRPVTDAFVKTSDHIRMLSIRGKDGNVETIKTTDDHPFFVNGIGWVTAAEMHVGQRIGTPDEGGLSVLLSTEREEYSSGINVYNFSVAGDQTYFVTDDTGIAMPIWVHNTCNPRLSINQINKRIATGNAPGTIIRADKGKIFGEKDHIHFSDGSALNVDGTWKHGVKALTNAERNFLKDVGWTLP